jgi:hypothetical protein
MWPKYMSSFFCGDTWQTRPLVSNVCQVFFAETLGKLGIWFQNTTILKIHVYYLSSIGFK